MAMTPILREFMIKLLFLLIFSLPSIAMPQALDCPCPQIMAHRGASGEYPQSTKLAFDQALIQGADILEIDVYLSRDKQVVVSHNDNLHYTTGYNQKISQLDYEKIANLDAGYLFSLDEGKSYPYRDKGLYLLTIDKLFDLYPKQRFNIEMKINDEQLALGLWQWIEHYKMENQVVVASRHSKVMDSFRKLSSAQVLTGATTAEVVKAGFTWAFGFGSRLEPDYKLVQLPYKISSKIFIDFLKSKNLVVHVWTVNELTEIKQSLDMGVDGIIGDYPSSDA